MKPDALPIAAEPTLPSPPKVLGGVVVAICALVAVSAAAGIVASLLGTPPAWFLLGFEVVALVAGVLGVLLGLGRCPGGPALGLLCVAGAVGVGALLGYLGAGRTLMGVSLRPFLLGRVASAGALIGIAAVMVLVRRPRVSVPRLGLGVGSAAALGVVGLVAWRSWGTLGGLSVPLQAVIGLVGFAVLLGLLAASVHWTIAAFAAGSVEDLRTDQPEPSESRNTRTA